MTLQLSTFYYLVFIDKLLYDLQKSSFGAKISSLKVGNPTFADKISLVTITPADLQRLINIVHEYANLWKFEISIEKSCIVAFTRKRSLKYIPIYYGKSVLSVKTETVHLGMLQSSNGKVKEKILERCQKAKNAYYAISGMGVRSQGLNQVTAASIYKRIVMPVALYGSELWNDMTKTDITTLNRLQHFVAKTIQGFHKRTRSDMCESMLGLFRLSSEVDKRKLQFLHKILSLPNHTISKQIFIMKYVSFLNDRRSVKCGFIPDISKIVVKYGLQSILNYYVNKNLLPTKCEWKKPQ